MEVLIFRSSLRFIFHIGHRRCCGILLSLDKNCASLASVGSSPIGLGLAQLLAKYSLCHHYDDGRCD
ncbi:MAG: hypothetical protein SNI70_11035 [Rikenellaceae bacterium]